MESTEMTRAVFCLASISACSSLTVILVLVRERMKSKFSRLVMLLHVFQCIDDVASLPVVFAQNAEFCAFVGFVHYYCSFCIVLACGAMYVCLYRLIKGQDIDRRGSYLEEAVVAGLPLICLLPFTTNSYGAVGEPARWCSLSDTRLGSIWSFIVLYSWSWFVLLGSLVGCFVFLYQAYSLDAEVNVKSFFLNVGIYPMITILGWIPRTIGRIASLDGRLALSFVLYNLPIYICGILYSATFYFELNNLREYNTKVTSRESIGGEISLSSVGSVNPVFDSSFVHPN